MIPHARRLERPCPCLLTAAKERAFAPRRVVFDNWYGSLENLKAIREHGWPWLTQLWSHRSINPHPRCRFHTSATLV